MHPRDAERRIQDIVAPFLGCMLDWPLKNKILAAVFDTLFDAELDEDELFFREIGGLLVEVWHGERQDGPDWVKRQPPDHLSPSPPIV